MPKKILGKYSWEIMKNIPEKYLAPGVPRVKVLNIHTWILYSYMSQFKGGFGHLSSHNGVDTPTTV